MPDVVQLLQKLGFGDYEARAYVGLLQRSPLTGYELAKATGIPRANVYGVLPRLEERGAVVRLDSTSGVRYSAVPPSELAGRLAGNFQDDLSAAQEALEAVSAPAEREYIWNASGYEALVDHARTLVESAGRDLLVAVWPQEAASLAGSISAARERGVGVTTLCPNACARECGACQGNIFRYSVSPQQSSRWLVVVADGSEMLAGEVQAGEGALAVRTRQHLLVELASWYIRHSVALAALLSDLGSRLPDLLSPETMSVLSSLGPGDHSEGWLEYMRGVLSRSGAA